MPQDDNTWYNISNGVIRCYKMKWDVIRCHEMLQDDISGMLMKIFPYDSDQLRLSKCCQKLDCSELQQNSNQNEEEEKRYTIGFFKILE